MFVNEKYKDILEIIEGKPLRNFLKRYNLSGGTSKADRRRKILESLVMDSEYDGNGIPVGPLHSMN